MSQSGARKPSSSTLLSGVALLLLALLLGGGVWTYRLLERGEQSMRESDQAFHRGALSESMRGAELALRAYVPGAPHVHAAEDRLRAIARGAEAEGKLTIARAAWDALRVHEERTDYPGRGATRYGEEASAALIRIDRRLAEGAGGP